MNIIKREQWGAVIRSPLQKINMGKVSALALHHMAHPSADIKEVERWHLNQGWRAFGYHYWVGFDGTVYEGRGYEHIGAGVEGQNDRIISIGFQGNYQPGIGMAVNTMSDAQFNSGVDIIKWVLGKVPGIKKIGGHKEYMTTACPGSAFPLDEFKTLKKRGVDIMFKDVAADDYAYNHIKKLKDYGIVNGDGDGNFKPDEMISRRDVAIMIANALTIAGK